MDGETGNNEEGTTPIENATSIIRTVDLLAEHYDHEVTYAVEPGKVIVLDTTPNHEHVANVLAVAFKQAGLTKDANTDSDGAGVAVHIEAIDNETATKANAAAFENSADAVAHFEAMEEEGE